MAGPLHKVLIFFQVKSTFHFFKKVLVYISINYMIICPLLILVGAKVIKLTGWVIQVKWLEVDKNLENFPILYPEINVQIGRYNPQEFFRSSSFSMIPLPGMEFWQWALTGTFMASLSIASQRNYWSISQSVHRKLWKCLP